MDHRDQAGVRAALPGIGILVLAIGATLAGTDMPPISVLLPLAVAAGIAAALSGRVRGDRAFRLAPAFYLAALIGLPAAPALLVGAVALTVSPRGLIGSWTGRASYAPAFAAVATVLLAILIPPPFGANPWWALGSLGALYLVLQGVAWAIGTLERGGRPDAGVHRAFAHAVTREAVSVPVAWLLVLLATTPGLPRAALSFACALAVLAAWSVARVERADGRIRAVNDSLAERVTELATLHAIGREIVSSLDLRRVITIIDRECRKILQVDEFAIALTDADTGDLRATYRRERGESPVEAEQRSIHEGLECRVARERRALRVDDLSARFAPEPALLAERTGSAMAVPLLVENRVVGVLAVRAELLGAFDDHRLAFLTTIAQQAAVAIENARHYRMATRDSLTGLFLRDYFFRRVEEEFQRARRYRIPFSLLMIDLDGFKRVNDRYGHQTGDRYLRAVGRAIHAHLRAADLACRYGGDEFCILLPETSRGGAAAIAERLRTAIAEVALDHPVETSIRATASVGLAAHPEDEEDDVSVLLRHADEALYRAKRSGRNRVAFRARSGNPEAVRIARTGEA